MVQQHLPSECGIVPHSLYRVLLNMGCTKEGHAACVSPTLMQTANTDRPVNTDPTPDPKPSANGCEPSALSSSPCASSAHKTYFPPAHPYAVVHRPVPLLPAQTRHRRRRSLANSVLGRLPGALHPPRPGGTAGRRRYGPLQRPLLRETLAGIPTTHPRRCGRLRSLDRARGRGGPFRLGKTIHSRNS